MAVVPLKSTLITTSDHPFILYLSILIVNKDYYYCYCYYYY